MRVPRIVGAPWQTSGSHTTKRPKSRTIEAILAPPSRQPGIERGAEPVAEEVEAQHGHEDRDAGREAEPGRDLEVLVALAQHRAPARGRRADPDAEERERRLGDDRRAD